MKEQCLTTKCASGTPETRDTERNLTPPVDIFETKEGLVVVADLPGVDKENVAVHVDNDTLTIQGKVQAAKADDPVYREFELRSFYRQFRLNEKVDREKIQAELKNGVLAVTLPFKEKAAAKQITVQAA